MSFKVGDKVTMKTSAGSRRVDKTGKLIGGSIGYKQPATLIAVGCQLPTYSGYWPHPLNNAIVQLCETKEVIFVHTDCLESVGKEIEVRFFCDGKDVTNYLSAETKGNLTRKF